MTQPKSHGSMFVGAHVSLGHLPPTPGRRPPLAFARKQRRPRNQRPAQLCGIPTAAYSFCSSERQTREVNNREMNR